MRSQDALATGSSSVIVCAPAGNVNTGARDPLGAIADACAVRGNWLHVDGAFGLWAAASPSRAHLVAGRDRADSWAVDAHKWLNVPYDAALAIARDPTAQKAAIGMSAAYLAVSGDRDPCRRASSSRRRRERDRADLARLRRCELTHPHPWRPPGSRYLAYQTGPAPPLDPEYVPGWRLEFGHHEPNLRPSRDILGTRASVGTEP
jgi:hypothetical protein